jgi:hypothetical protein
MPAVLAMAGTAMPDVAAMSLGVAGMERLLAWSQDRRAHQATLAAALLGLAALSRSHLGLLLPVGAVLLLPAARSAVAWRERLRLYLPILAAPAFMGVITFITHDPLQGSGGIVDTAAYYSSGATTRILSNLIALPIHWVLAMGLALPWAVLRWRTMIRTRSVLIAAAAGAAVGAAALVHLERPSIALALVTGLGVAVLWEVLAEGWKRREYVQMALGSWLLIAACAIPYVHLPAKFLVASAPAAALLVARELSTRSGRMPRVLLSGVVALGLGLGVAILRADAALAEVGRRATAELIEPRVAAGQRVWFVGHWGFQWYAENAGARPVTLTPPYPSRGDFLVVDLGGGTSTPLLDMMANRFPQMNQVGHVLDSDPGGRVMDAKLGVGFYSNAAGHLPWAWGTTPVDVFMGFDL